MRMVVRAGDRKTEPLPTGSCRSGWDGSSSRCGGEEIPDSAERPGNFRRPVRRRQQICKSFDA